MAMLEIKDLHVHYGVIEALKGEYGNFKALKKDAVISSLMTAEANGLLEERRFDPCAFHPAKGVGGVSGKNGIRNRLISIKY